jgi:hypothetical protein
LQKPRHKMHTNRPDLLENSVLVLHNNALPHLGKDVRELLLPHPPYSPNMSPRTSTCSQNWKSTCMVCVLNTGGPFCFRTVQRPDGYHGPSKMLGWSHSAEGGLHWRTSHFTTHLVFHSVGIAFCAFLLRCPT